MFAKHIKIRFFILYCVVLAVTKIYQTNLVTQAVYRSQRLSRQISILKNRKNILLESFFAKIRYDVLAYAGQATFGLVPLDPAQLVTKIPAPKLEFIGSYSSDSLLLTLGLIEQKTEEGDKHGSEGLSNKDIFDFGAIRSSNDGSIL